MALDITPNSLSLLLRRHLSGTTNRMQTASERLGSGERINRAADNPGGMAISEGMRAEIQSVRRSQQNISSAFGALGTADSALGNMVEQLQRARELALQANSETLSATNRQALQTELARIVEQLDYTAQTTQYNGLRVLDGTLRDAVIQTGPDASQSMRLTLPSFATASLGAYATATGSGPVSATALGAGDLSINGVAIPASAPDGVSTSLANASARAKAVAINSVSADTGVTARAEPTTGAAIFDVQPVSINGVTQTLRINGYSIGSVNVQAGDAGGALVAAINNIRIHTGVAATVTEGRLELTADDGRNIEVATTGSIADELGLSGANGDVSLTYAAAIALESVERFTFTDSNDRLGFGAASRTIDPDPATAADGIDLTSVDGAKRALATIDAALSQIGHARATVGTLTARMESFNATLASRVETLTGVESRIRDADFALETAQLAQAEILMQAELAVLAQANVTPRKALELLRG